MKTSQLVSYVISISITGCTRDVDGTKKSDQTFYLKKIMLALLLKRKPTELTLLAIHIM